MTRVGAMMIAVVITAFVVGFLLGALGASYSYESGLGSTPVSARYHTVKPGCQAWCHSKKCNRHFF